MDKEEHAIADKESVQGFSEPLSSGRLDRTGRLGGTALERSESLSAEAQEDTAALSAFKNRLYGSKEAQGLYERAKEKVGDSEEADLIALYIAGGLYGGDDAQFAETLNVLEKRMNLQSRQVVDLLLQNEDRLKEESFIYQMVLNLAYNLQIPSRVKAEVLGRSLDQGFKVTEFGEVPLESTNVTNAMILMKNAGLNIQDVAPFIRKGLDATPAGVSRDEYLVRVQTYFPEYFEQFPAEF